MDDLLQRSTLVTALTILHDPLFCVCPERGFNSMKVASFLQVSGCIGGSYHNNSISTLKRKY